MGKVTVLEGREEGEGFGLVVNSSGKIAAVGRDSDIDAEMKGGRARLHACAVLKLLL